MCHSWLHSFYFLSAIPPDEKRKKIGINSPKLSTGFEEDEILHCPLLEMSGVIQQFKQASAILGKQN